MSTRSDLTAISRLYYYYYYYYNYNLVSTTNLRALTKVSVMVYLLVSH